METKAKKQKIGNRRAEDLRCGDFVVSLGDTPVGATMVGFTEKRNGESIARFAVFESGQEVLVGESRWAKILFKE